MTETFSLGTLLSVVTGRVLTTVNELYRVADYVTGTSHLTHQLPRVFDEIRPWLLQRYPWLADEDLVMPEELSSDVTACRAWLDAKEAERGATFEVDPLPEGAYVPRNAVSELRAMLGPEKPIIVVEP